MTSVLRYPYEALTETTDYLQLTIKEYDAGGLTAGAASYVNASAGTSPAALQNIAASALKPAVLGKDGIIILPMPSNIEDTNSVSYDGDSLNALSKIGAEVAQSTIEGVKLDDIVGSTTKVVNKVSEAIGGQSGELKNIALKALAAQAVNVFGAGVSLNQLLARSGGKILNPNMELLFNNVTLRTFRFSFKMTPRDEVESMQVKSIIRTLKKNMAAKKANLYLKTPNIFELEYKKGNKLHPFLHRFKQCALSDMSVNYTGENVYATYSDGTPISIILTLTFKELVPIYEEDYHDDAFKSGYDTDYKDKPNDLATAMDYGLASKRTSDTNIGTQRDVEGVGY